MRQMIDELKAIPGVVGASIYRSGEGLQETNLPVIFKPERLNAVGKHLSKLYSAGRLSFPDLTDITLNYDESVVVARELEKNLLLFVFCDPSFNHNLLSMSFNLLQEDFSSGNFSSGNFSTGITTSASSVDMVADEKGSAAEPDAALSELLAVMRQRLSKVLGPMAGFIFDEVVDVWQKNGASDYARIDELIDGLGREIDDAEKVDRYRQLIAPDLQAYQGE